MRFNQQLTWLSLSLCAMLVVACGTRQMHRDEKRKQIFTANSYLWRSGGNDRIVVVNERARTIESFTLEPFAHLASVELPHSSSRAGVVGSDQGEFFVTLASNDYAIVKRTGESLVNPAKIAGDIQGVAFDAARNLLAITSSFQNLTLISLDDVGNVLASFDASGIAEAGKALGPATMLGDGRMAVVVGDTNLYVIDIPASLAQQVLVKATFAIEAATSMGWINHIPGLAQAVLVLDGSRLLVVDTNTGVIIDQKSLAETQVIGRFREYHPHIVSQNAGQQAQNVIEVSFAGMDGKLVTRTLRGTGFELGETWLDAANLNFTAMFIPGAQINMLSDREQDEADAMVEVYRYDLTQASNQLPFDQSEIDLDLRTIVMPGYLFVQHKSALGKSERRTYGATPERQFLEGYNLDHWRRKFPR